MIKPIVFNNKVVYSKAVGFQKKVPRLVYMELPAEHI